MRNNIGDNNKDNLRKWMFKQFTAAIGEEIVYTDEEYCPEMLRNLKEFAVFLDLTLGNQDHPYLFAVIPKGFNPETLDTITQVNFGWYTVAPDRDEVPFYFEKVAVENLYDQLCEWHFNRDAIHEKSKKTFENVRRYFARKVKAPYCPEGKYFMTESENCLLTERLTFVPKVKELKQKVNHKIVFEELRSYNETIGTSRWSLNYSADTNFLENLYITGEFPKNDIFMVGLKLQCKDPEEEIGTFTLPTYFAYINAMAEKRHLKVFAEYYEKKYFEVKFASFWKKLLFAFGKEIES